MGQDCRRHGKWDKGQKRYPKKKITLLKRQSSWDWHDTLACGGLLLRTHEGWLIMQLEKVRCLFIRYSKRDPNADVCQWGKKGRRPRGATPRKAVLGGVRQMKGLPTFTRDNVGLCTSASSLRSIWCLMFLYVGWKAITPKCRNMCIYLRALGPTRACASRDYSLYISLCPISFDFCLVIVWCLINCLRSSCQAKELFNI